MEIIPRSFLIQYDAIWSMIFSVHHVLSCQSKMLDV